MNRNLIYIISINDPNKQIQCQDYAKYSILTWEYYCKKYGIDLVILDENIGNFKYPIFNKELVYEYQHKYDKIGIVDSDTMVRWDAPNIFDLIEDGIYGVNDLANLDWLIKSVSDRQKYYPNVNIDLMKYVNAGVLFFTSNVCDSFKKVLNTYLNFQHEIDLIDGGGKEQTLLNFQLQEDNVKVNLLNPEWNLFSIEKKNMFKYNWQLNNNFNPYFMKYAFVWHFTGFPIEDRTSVMRQTWEYINENYIN